MHTRRIALVLAAAVMLTAAPAAAASAHPPPALDSPVARWASHHAVRVPGDPSRPGPDLRVMSRVTAGAQVIGLGEPGHRFSEVATLQGRYLRHLVTRGGVRAIAWELDWTLGIRLDDYLQGRHDDLDAIMLTLEDIWQTTEVREVMEWLRQYNDTHVDDVRLAGAEYFATGLLAYDAVEAYLATHAPGQWPELEPQLALLTPDGDDIGAHLRQYMAIADKSPYLDASAAILDAVASLGGTGDASEIVLQHARQIRWWYEGFSLPLDDIADYRDAKAAENVRWWQRFTGERTVYWGASAHIADAPRVTITEPGQPDTTFASAGSRLEDWYGPGYVAVGFTYDRGTYRADDGSIVDLPPARAGWVEQPLGDVRADRFVLRLEGRMPSAVRDWLTQPLITRGLPEYGDASTASGGTLAEWFDVLVHSQVVSPARPL